MRYKHCNNCMAIKRHDRLSRCCALST